MSLSYFLYRQKQRWKYHTAQNLFEKRIAEVNRHEEVIYLSDQTFTVKDSDLKFSRQYHAFIVEGIELFLELSKGGRFITKGDDLFYIIDVLSLSVTTAEELFIIHEIFFEGCYSIATHGEFNVIDIGMNVGFASLFFAKSSNIKKIYSFEPFNPTYQQALINFKNNKLLATKIECFPYGLSDKAETLEVDYTYTSKGQVGIYGTNLIKSEVGQSTRLTIDLVSAGDELRKIFEACPGQRFMLKTDCEGAEYGIFKNLAQHKLLNNIDIVFIEWHKMGPEPLLAILVENNFKAFYQQAAGKQVGMIYAAR